MAYGGEELQFHEFWISALVRGKRLAVADELLSLSGRRGDEKM
jgi:hypothetical protein